MYKNFSKVYDNFTQYLDYDKWTEFLEETMKKYVEGKRKILDLGCGTGEVLLRLNNKYIASGLDLSKGMLKKANIKLKGKEIPLYLGDMREFNTGEKYDIIFSFFDTVNHLTSKEDLLDCFNSVKNSLEDGGIYFFDVVEEEFMEKMFSSGAYAHTEKDFSLIWEHEYDKEEDIHIIDATYFIKNKSKTYDRYEETYEKKIFSREEMEKAIRLSDFEIVEVIKREDLAGERNFYILRNVG